MARDRKKINVKAGGKIQIRELSPTASNTYVDLGYLTSSNLADEPGMVESIDETGAYIDTKSGSRKVVWKTVLKQTSADEINLLKNADGKYYEVYYNVKLADTNVQMFCLCLCKIKPSIPLAFAAATERTLEVEFSALAPSGDFTRTVGTFNIVKDEPYAFVEASSETFNTSNTEAAALYAAIK